MLTLLTIVHFLVSIFLIVIVLLQHGKGADMGASFGGGSGKTVFGTEGPLPLLNKITTASAIIFMCTSVALAYYSANTTKSSVMKSLPISQQKEKKVEVAPTAVEIPMKENKPTAAGEKPAAPAQFPGTKAPVSESPTPPAQGEAKQAEPQAQQTAPAVAPVAAPAPTTEPTPATQPETKTQEKAPAPTPGQ
jgi:preprotein translocase subunit SecG